MLTTVIEPLREDWKAVKAAALLSDRPGAVEQVRAFHRRLCDVRVLDPACGTGNFLYVALEHMKRLEGEVADFLSTELGENQQVLELDTHTVDPRQFLGIEKNERAVAIAEPVLRNFHTIEHRDAVLAWDGESMTLDLTTGREIPAAECRVPLYRYTNPRPATWPEAHFIVGNPPFIGGKDLRQRLGDGYAAALRAAYPAVPDSADLVMYWWHLAADRVRDGRTRRLGFITTNSITQAFNRRVIAHHLAARPPLSLVFAIPDHPWVKTLRDTDSEALRQAAAVRIAMTVAEAGDHDGILATLTAEAPGPTDAAEVQLSERVGRIQPDLTIGAEVSAARKLAANAGLSSRGMSLHGAGFIVTPQQAADLGLGSIPGLERHIRPYLNGRDLTGRSRGAMVIDLFGLAEDDIRRTFPNVFQHLRETVWPERAAKDGATPDAIQYARHWWLFGKPRPVLREALAGLPRYIATVETAKHRLFCFLDAAILPDNKLVAIASQDALHLGILSSRIHVAWAFVAGGRMGVGNDPVYNKTLCFDTFPFPLAAPREVAAVRALGEELDGFRKARLAEHPDLTLTGLYNVVEKLRTRQALSPTERDVHDRGLVATLAAIHDQLDLAVADAYGWAPDLPVAEMLERLVRLNRQRAEEERRGQVAWLRPEYQAPAAGHRPAEGERGETLPLAARAIAKEAWPSALLDQVSAIRLRLNRLPAPAEPSAIAGSFRGARRDRVAEVLATLAAMGHARQQDGRYWRC